MLHGKEYMQILQGPSVDTCFFVLMDAHSKWPEVILMNSTTTGKTIEVLRSIFAQQGLPEQLVTDNGPQFTSSDFENFLKSNGIKHILSAPYHPASNGLVERFIQTMKRTLKAGGRDGKSIHHRLAEFLFEYRATPHSTTNTSPSELLMNRKLRTRFDLMSPFNTRSYVTGKQADQKLNHDKHAKSRKLLPGSIVMLRDYNHSNKWINGIIVKKLGPVTYWVEMANGRLVKRHMDQLREGIKQQEIINIPSEDTSIQDNHMPEEYPTPADPDIAGLPIEPMPPAQTVIPQPTRRYPERVHRPPDRYIHDRRTF
jgi:hypothetical protein